MKILYIYAALLWVMALFLISSDYKMIKQSNFLKKNTDLSEYTVYDYSKNHKILFGVILVLSIITSLAGLNDYSYFLINFAIIVISIVEIITGVKTMKLYYNTNSIIYDNEVIRLKSIKSIKKVKKFGRNFELTTLDGNHYMMNSKVADIIQQRLDEIKEEKNAKKKK